MVKQDAFEKWIESGDAENNLAIIQSLSMQGKSMTEIAQAFGITRKTLYNLHKKHPAIRKAIDTGRLSVVAMCQNKLMERVSNGDTTAIIYALKVYGGDFFNDRRGFNAKPTDSGQPQVLVYLPAIDVETDDGNEQKS